MTLFLMIYEVNFVKPMIYQKDPLQYRSDWETKRMNRNSRKAEVNILDTLHWLYMQVNYWAIDVYSQ